MAASLLPPGAENFLPRTPTVDFSTEVDTSTLKNKSVLITGGAVGLGFACAETIASYGAIVTIADIQESMGQAAAEKLNLKGYKVRFVQCDVTSYESQFEAFKAAIEYGGGRLDVVIPNAGVIAERNIVDMAATSEPSLETPPLEPGLSGLDINLKGVYYSCYLALHYFRLPPPPDATPFKKGIVLISSLAGYAGYPFSTTYSISKFGVRGILYGIRDQAIQCDPPVRVNLVAPWYINTPMVENLDNAAAVSHVQLFRCVPVESVVAAVVRFGADESISGRSAGIYPAGTFDVGDNIWEGYGGKGMQERMVVETGTIFKNLAEMEKGSG